MGLWSWVSDTLGWTDTAMTAQVNREQSEILQQQRAAGKVSDARYNQIDALINDSTADDLRAQIDKDAAEGFKSGWQDAADKLRRFVEDTINQIFGFTFGATLRLIPWQLWLAGAGLLGWWVWRKFIRK